MVNVSNEWLIEWLDARFGHADYLRLSRKWKLIHFDNVANEIIEMIKIELKGKGNEPIK